MLFHSFGFFIFFFITFAVYWSLRRHELRMSWLVLASVVFYAAWNPWFILLISFTAGIDYVFAQQIERAVTPRRRKSLLIASLTINLALLGFFKYANFLLGACSGFLEVSGIHVAAPVLPIVLPLGISFYTFETISYVVDVYRRQLPAERNPLHYALYIMFFPHLISGPIVRAGQFLPQIRSRKHFDWPRFQLGVQLFLRGLLKKAALADRLALIVDPIFHRPADFSSATLWLAAIGYAVQAYCDFSGYTDMALGAAHVLGFKLPQNFNRPYLSASIGEFWRRWHITLSSWVRDYVYIPLGGSRATRWKTYRNLIVTMAVVGLWHGAGWTFLAFGVYHGVLLSLERACPLPAWTNRGLARAVRIVLTFLLLCLGLVIFRGESLGQAMLMLGHMLRPIAGSTLSPLSIILAAAIILLVFAAHLLGHLRTGRKMARLVPVPAMGLALACQFLLTQLLMPADTRPFIYFQF